MLRGGEKKDNILLSDLKMTKIDKTPITKDLRKQLSRIRNKQALDVTIFLNNDSEENDYMGLTLSGYLDFKGQSHILPVRLQDLTQNYFYEKIKNLAPWMQAQKIGEKLEEIRQENKKIRVKKSKKIVEKLSRILDIKIDNGQFDTSAGLVNLKLTKTNILKLMNNPSLIQKIDLKRKTKNELLSAFDEIRLRSTQYSVRDYGGDGIGVYMNEANNLCFEQNRVSQIEDLIGLGGGIYTEDRPSDTLFHADVVAQSIRMASPESHIYCSDKRYSIPSDWKDNINIINYSWSYTSLSEEPGWSNYDTAADMLAYNDNVQVFISAQNDCNNDIDGNGKIECIVGAPAKSHNALTVGAYNDVTDRMASFSDWNVTGIHPEDHPYYSDYTKPEILAPGVFLNSAGILNPGYNPPRNDWSGTSFSSPMAAGTAASLLSVPVHQNMKSSQALMKAAMIAMSSKNDITDNGHSRRSSASALQWNPYILWTWWDQPNSFLDNADGQWMKLDEKYLYAGYDIKAVLSWSNRTDRCDGRSGGDSYNGPDDYLCMDLDFKVLAPDGAIKLISTSYSNNFEGGIFHTDISGNYEFYVKRYSNWYEWTKKWPWSSKKYYYNRAKMGLAVAYIVNR